MLIDIEKILRVAGWGKLARRGFGEDLALDQFDDFRRYPLRYLTAQFFKQLVGDPIHYFIDDALRDDNAFLRFIRKRACGRLGLGAVYKRVKGPGLSNGLYGCVIGEYVIQFKYVVHI